MAGPDDGDALLTGPGFDKAAQGAAQLDVPPGLWQWRGEDVCVDGHDGQVRLRAGRDDGAGNTVVDAQFVAEGEVETVIKPGTQQIRREFFVSLEEHAGQPELALLIVVVRVVEGRLADEELRHIVVEELVEVVRADHDQDIRSCAGQRLAVGRHLAHPLVRKVGPALRRRGAGTVEEWMMRGREDSDDFCHTFLLLRMQPPHIVGCSVRWASAVLWYRRWRLADRQRSGQWPCRCWARWDCAVLRRYAQATPPHARAGPHRAAARVAVRCRRARHQPRRRR